MGRPVDGTGNINAATEQQWPGPAPAGVSSLCTRNSSGNSSIPTRILPGQPFQR